MFEELSYLPFGIGAGMSLWRAVGIYQDRAGAVGAALRANTDIVKDADAIRANLAAETLGTQGGSVLHRLSAMGITDYNLSDSNLRIIDSLGSKSHQALFDFLNSPALGLSSREISQQIGRIKHGANVSEILQKYATTQGQREAFFGALIRSEQDPFGFGFNLTGGAFGEVTSAPTMGGRKIESHQLSKIGRERYNILRRFGPGGENELFRSVRLRRAFVPGLVRKSGQGTGYVTYAMLSGGRGKHSFRATVPLEIETFSKLTANIRGNNITARLPIGVFHSGKYLETLNVLPRFASLDPKAGGIMNYGEALFWGRRGEGHPIVDRFLHLKELMKSSGHGAVGRELSGFYSSVVSPEQGMATYIPNFINEGFRKEGILRTQLVQMMDWNEGETKYLPLEEKAILAARWPGIKVGASPAPMESRGLFMIPSDELLKLSNIGEPFQGSFPQERRIFQAFFNPHTVAKSNLKAFTNKTMFGPLGSSMKPWHRHISPMMSALGQALAGGESPSVYNYFTRFVIDPDTQADLQRFIGDGGMGLMTRMPSDDFQMLMRRVQHAESKLSRTQKFQPLLKMSKERFAQMESNIRYFESTLAQVPKSNTRMIASRKKILSDLKTRYANQKELIATYRRELREATAGYRQAQRQLKLTAPSTQREAYRKELDKRTQQILATQPSTEFVSSEMMERYARNRARFEMSMKYHIAPPGPTTSVEYEKTIARGSTRTANEPSFIYQGERRKMHEIIAIEGGWDKMRKRGFRLKNPIEVMPGEALGTLRSATGLEWVEARRTFGQHKILGIIPGGEKEARTFKLMMGVDAPMQEMWKGFLGGKLVAKPFSYIGFKRMLNDLGIPDGPLAEAITGTAELTKNPQLLRNQQVSALQMYAYRNKSIGRRLLNYDSAWQYLVGMGRRVMKDQGMSDVKAGLFGMFKAAQGLGLSPEEYGYVFGAQKLIKDSNDLFKQASQQGLLSPTALRGIQSSKQVFGLLPISPGKLSGEMSGGMGSIERRGWEILYKNLPADLSKKVIPDIASRLMIDRNRINLAREWFENPKSFAKGADLVDLTSATSADVKAILDGEPFLKGTRRTFKLPKWVTGEGPSRFTIPSHEEMALLEAEIVGTRGPIKTPFRRSLDLLLNQMQSDLEAGSQSFARTGRQQAQGLYQEMLQEQVGIHQRLYRSLFGSGGVPIAGSVYAHAGVRAPRNIMGFLQDTALSKTELASTVFVSDYVFEKQARDLLASGADPKYIENMRRKFYNNKGIASIIGRHPLTGSHSLTPMLMRRAGSVVGDPKADKYLASMYFTEQSVIADGKKGTFSAWSAMHGDYDHDMGPAIMMRSAETERSLYRYIQNNKLDLRKRIVDHSLLSAKIEKLWPSSDGATVQALRDAVGGSEEAYKFVKATTALGGIGDVGKLTNALAILEQATIGMSDVRPSPNVMSPRETMSLLTEKLAQAPISSKKYGQSLASDIADELQRIFLSAGDAQRKGMVSSSAGQQLVEAMFGSGGFLSAMNMQDMHGAGIVVNYELEGSKYQARAQITEKIQNEFAANIDELVARGVPESIEAFQRKYPSIQNMQVESLKQLRELYNDATSFTFADIALADNQIANIMAEQSSGVAGASVHVSNVGKKLQAMSKALRGKWHYISKPLLLGTLLTAGAYSVLSPQGYAKEPLSMPGEQIDSRIMAAIRSGDLLSGGHVGGAPQMGMPDGPAYATAARHDEMGAPTATAHYNSAMGQFSDRISMPVARLSIQSQPNFNIDMNPASQAEAVAMAQHFQSHLPSARIGVTSRAAPDFLAANRQDEYL